MSWHGGGVIIDGIVGAIEGANVTGDMSIFWSTIVDVLDNLDYSDWHSDFGANDDLDRILALREMRNTIDWDLPHYDEALDGNRSYLTAEDIQLLEAIKKNSTMI